MAHEIHDPEFEAMEREIASWDLEDERDDQPPRRAPHREARGEHSRAAQQADLSRRTYENEPVPRDPEAARRRAAFLAGFDPVHVERAAHAHGRAAQTAKDLEDRHKLAAHMGMSPDELAALEGEDGTHGLDQDALKLARQMGVEPRELATHGSKRAPRASHEHDHDRDRRVLARQMGMSLDELAALEASDAGKASHVREEPLRDDRYLSKEEKQALRDSKKLAVTKDKIDSSPESVAHRYWAAFGELLVAWQTNLPSLVDAGKTVQREVDNEIARVLGVSVGDLPQGRWDV